MCNGAGKSIPRGSECNDCDGVGKVKKRQTVDVDIPAGVEDGMRMRVSGKGDAPLEGDGPSGDLILEINVMHHSSRSIHIHSLNEKEPMFWLMLKFHSMLPFLVASFVCRL